MAISPEPPLAAPPAADAPGGEPNLNEYTIDELARAGGTTVRNVRAYQDRGLLSPPERRGRVGIYTGEHLRRLTLIHQLLSRGYTLANIQELFDGLEKGQHLHDFLGLEQAIGSPWSTETPRLFTMPELLKMFGISAFAPATLSRVLKLGLLKPEGIRFRAPNPKILYAGAELTKAGMPLDDMLLLVEHLRINVERVADEMVQMIARLLDRYDGRLPPAEDVPRLADLIWRLRPLANMAVDSEVSRALERSANKFLGERVAQILEHMRPPALEGPKPG
ncbi:MerR family transcriptional regulator [Solimonas variicoloris]|uniref:MerR family transcriptional regulator n=1 Tax=Solimonas variicoloris TaxID=254408 RepID=UPI0012B649BB|nr:MerR family transcriptional regulator [Solimonas variicoloris]